MALQKISGSTETFGHCNCYSSGNCLNISVCNYTTNKVAFTVTAWNPQGWPTTSVINVPVSGSSWKVVDSTGAVLSSQVTALDNRTLELPLLYLNTYKMSTAAITAAQAALSNKATHVLSFTASTPAVGYASFTCSATPAPALDVAIAKRAADQPPTVSNGVYQLQLDWTANRIAMITNLKTGVSSTLSLKWGYYTSNPGGCSYYTNGTSFGCKSKEVCDVVAASETQSHSIVTPIRLLERTFFDQSIKLLRLPRPILWREWGRQQWKWLRGRYSLKFVKRIQLTLRTWYASLRTWITSR